MPRHFPTTSERFWQKVRKTDECWYWEGGRTQNLRFPYGTFYAGGGRKNAKNMVAHRYAYETLVGPIGEGLYLDHLCQETMCVNPAHLEPVTAAENFMRGFMREHNVKVFLHPESGWSPFLIGLNTWSTFASALFGTAAIVIAIVAILHA